MDYFECEGCLERERGWTDGEGLHSPLTLCKGCGRELCWPCYQDNLKNRVECYDRATILDKVFIKRPEESKK